MNATLRRQWPLLLIIGGLLVWGLFHSLGAYLSLAQRPGWSVQSAQASELVRQQEQARPAGRDPRKALIVGLCSAGFVGFWLAALALAHRRRLRAAQVAELLTEREAETVAATVAATVAEDEDHQCPTPAGGGG